MRTGDHEVPKLARLRHPRRIGPECERLQLVFIGVRMASEEGSLAGRWRGLEHPPDEIVDAIDLIGHRQPLDDSSITACILALSANAVGPTRDWLSKWIGRVNVVIQVN